MLAILRAIADKLEVDMSEHSDVEVLTQEKQPERLAQQIEKKAER